MMRKICIFTGTRAEYGLLKPLMAAVKRDPALELQILASCMHLAPEFGLTYREIEKDGFHIDEKVENLMSSDSPIGICKSMGLGLIGYGEALERLKPDINVILGDRFEAFAFAAAAMISRQPIAHLHGGEATRGLIDEAIRHSITKMSHVHFASTAEYRRRVIQLGEDPDAVYDVGAIGVENIQHLQLLSKGEIEHQTGFTFGDVFALVTFHPVTLEENSASQQMTNLLAALDQFPELRFVFTKSNADTQGRIINSLIDDFVSLDTSGRVAFTSMGQLRYLSAMRHASIVIGNSSSGIIEAPTMQTPTVNIGDRQAGRIKARSVIDCDISPVDIAAAIGQALELRSNHNPDVFKNPYEKAGTVANIVKVLKDIDLENIQKKEFYNLDRL